MYFERRQRRDLFASKEAAVVGRTLKRLNLLSKRKCCSACPAPADVLLSLHTALCEAALFPLPLLQKVSFYNVNTTHPAAMQFPSPGHENLIFCGFGENIYFIICNTPDTLAQLQRKILIRLLALLPVSDATSLFLLLYNHI